MDATTRWMQSLVISKIYHAESRTKLITEFSSLIADLSTTKTLLIFT